MTDRAEAYAEAIVDIAKGEDALDAVDDELLRLARAVGENRDLHELLTNQQHPVGRRLEAIDEVLRAAHPATRSSVALLVSSGRIRQLDRIAQLVAERSAAERRKELAEVYVATPLDEQRRDRLRQALEQVTGKELELKVFVDPDVVGGVRAKIGDEVIDGTVARRLQQIKTRLGA